MRFFSQESSGLERHYQIKGLLRMLGDESRPISAPFVRVTVLCRMLVQTERRQNKHSVSEEESHQEMHARLIVPCYRFGAIYYLNYLSYKPPQAARNRYTV